MAKNKTDLLQGTLDLIVLKLLRAGPANGWDLTQSIQLVSKGALDVNYGSLYPALRRLEARGWVTAPPAPSANKTPARHSPAPRPPEARGWVTAHWAPSENNRRARYYELTAAGRKQLTEERAAWQRFSQALGLILDTD